jgi:hypothetical protein
MEESAYGYNEKVESDQRSIHVYCGSRPVSLAAITWQRQRTYSHPG